MNMNMKVFTSTNQRMMVWGKSMLNQFPFEFLFACSSQIILEGDGLSCCVMDTSSRKKKCHIDSPFGCADKGCISIPSDQVPIPKQIWQWLKNWHAKGPRMFIKVDPFLEGSHTFQPYPTRFSRGFSSSLTARPPSDVAATPPKRLRSKSPAAMAGSPRQNLTEGLSDASCPNSFKQA